MTKFLTAAFAVLLSTFAAQAATFTTDVTEGGHGIIVLEGTIADGDDARLAQAYAALAAKGKVPEVLFLNSPGGKVLAGADLSMLVRTYGIRTAISGTQLCASICVLVWASGEGRYYAPGSRIGVHAVSDHTNKAADGSGEENLAAMGATTLIARALVALGAPDRVVIKMISTEGDDIAWLTSADVGNWATLINP